MIRPRVIPILLLQDGGLVKGEKFKKHEYVGDPINAVKIFNDSYADEISLLDIDCTANNREPNYALIKEVASEAFMPMSYGGGLNKIEQVRKILHSGVEKVIFNTSAFQNRDLITQTAREFGSSSTVVSIDVKGSLFGGKKVFVANGKKATGQDPVSFARKMEALGAGEVILTAIDKEGTMSGYDTDLIRQVAAAVNIPVIANGGAGKLSHFKEAFQAGAAAAAAGSMFVFVGSIKGVLINYPTEEQLNSI
ncbi:AglZ/HisF2 family acetamidino modification protein [Taibaiella koreensis]|uniref:AglZ/HisF2 family acetamidino modification protein n=1 Tax=Taibaiella koreensis TaxID=1268548 RepID=UPI000E599FCE|nr:AglZ/HisF2 family acetamidino modification protein [Taibaiella koreensis]